MYDHKNQMMLNPVSENDLGSLGRLKKYSWITTHQTVYVTPQSQQEWFKSIDNQKNVYMIVSKPSVMGVGRDASVVMEQGGDVGFIGVTNIDPVSRVAGVTASLFHLERKEGQAKKVWEVATDFAFEMHNLHRVECEVLSNNVVSLKLCLALGYKIEGIRRQAIYKSGIYLDSYMLSLLRPEWSASPRVKEMGGVCNSNARRPNVSKVFEDGGVDLLPEELRALENAITAIDFGRNPAPH